MDTIALTTNARNTELKPSALRREGTVPCVVYGNNIENTTVQCEHRALYKAYEKAGENTVVELDMDGKKVPVLFHAIDFHPVSENILHVDFYAVDMNKKIEAAIPLNIVGIAPAVKDLSGVLITVVDHVNVSCLPADLPHALDVDITGLETFEDSLKIGDAQIPANVELTDDPELVMITVQAPRAAVEAEQEEGEGEEGEGGEGEAAEGGEEKKDEE